MQFQAEWKSVNNDALLMSYGYCSTLENCFSGYRNAGCTWQAERSSSNNLPQVLDRVVSGNPNFRNFCECIRCSCQSSLLVIGLTVSS